MAKVDGKSCLAVAGSLSRGLTREWDPLDAGARSLSGSVLIFLRAALGHLNYAPSAAPCDVIALDY